MLRLVYKIAETDYTDNKYQRNETESSILKESPCSARPL